MQINKENVIPTIVFGASSFLAGVVFVLTLADVASKPPVRSVSDVVSQYPPISFVGQSRATKVSLRWPDSDLFLLGVIDE